MENIYDNIANLYYAQENFVKARDYFCKAAVVSIMNDSSNSLFTKPIVGSVYVCYIKSGGNEDEFEKWLEERIKTYPSC